MMISAPTGKGEPRAEYIALEAVYREICTDSTMSGYEKAYCFELIRNIAVADVSPVVHGRWVIVDDGVMIGDGKHLECSVCHTWKKDRIKTDYCPNCGARMDIERQDNG